MRCNGGTWLTCSNRFSFFCFLSLLFSPLVNSPHQLFIWAWWAHVSFMCPAQCGWCALQRGPAQVWCVRGSRLSPQRKGIPHSVRLGIDPEKLGHPASCSSLNAPECKPGTLSQSFWQNGVWLYLKILFSHSCCWDLGRSCLRDGLHLGSSGDSYPQSHSQLQGACLVHAWGFPRGKAGGKASPRLLPRT